MIGGGKHKQQLRQALTEVAFTKFPVYVDPDKEKLEKQQREEAGGVAVEEPGGSRRLPDAGSNRDRCWGGAGLVGSVHESAAMTVNLGAREGPNRTSSLLSSSWGGRTRLSEHRRKAPLR